MTMPLNEYLEQMKEDIKNFQSYWLKSKETDPESFSDDDMQLGDWDEQFNGWIEIGRPESIK